MTPPLPPESCKVYTPKPLASAMVRALGDNPTDRWLDPCVGHGVFLSALSEIGVEARRVTAIDLASRSAPNDSLGWTLRGTDFLNWCCTTELRYDKIVGNPPYVALNKLKPVLRNSALALTGPDGSQLPLGSNYWIAFLYASLKLLRPGGGLCFVLPAAWDYADYAASLRVSLPKRFSHFEIHRSRKPLFDSVQDGSIVIVGRGFGQPGGAPARFEHDSAAGLIAGLTSDHRAIVHEMGSQLIGTRHQKTCRLGDVIDIRLGGVTGDANYFLLTESERVGNRLPVDCLRPVLSKARHLVAGEITQATWKALRNADERVWLFDPPPRLLKHPGVRAYLGLSLTSGGCRRNSYKIRNRYPWYRTPLPRRVDGFISGMSQFGPWLSLSSMPRLTATNTLYVVRFRESLTKDQQASFALSLLATLNGQNVQLNGRLYPEGLLKYEPGDLVDLPLRVPRRIQGALIRYEQAIHALRSGDIDECQELANRWLS